MAKRNYLIMMLVLALAVVGTGCNSGGEKAASGDNYPKGPIEMIAPAGAGGGWDTTIRSVAKVLKDQELVETPLPVINKVGGGGGIALSHMQRKKGGDKEIVVYSPPLLLINLSGQTPYSYKDLTPLAKLIEDYGIFVVRKDSPYKNIDDVMEALKKDPTSLSIAGTSSPGSMDHIQFLQAAKAAGIKDLKKIKYVSFQGNESVANLLGGHVDIVSTGLSDAVGLIESGDVRALAVTAPERINAGVLSEIPTLKEQGINTVFVNWRGLFGPAEMPDHAIKFWKDTLAKMVETEQWDEIAKNNGWNKAFQAEGFDKFLEETNESYKVILEEIGMLK